MKKLIFLLPLLFLSACVLPPNENAPPDATNTPQNTTEVQSASQATMHGHADEAQGEISPAELHDKLQSGKKFVLLDVREAEEYDEAHIPGTTARISVKELSDESLANAGIRPDDEIVVYCRSGNRSKQAVEFMRGLGYTNIRDLNSGIVHWTEDGFPVERGAAFTEFSHGDHVMGPLIGFDRPSHDFGEVKQFGGTVSTTFTVTNRGSAPLEIGTITTSCACTAAELKNKTIQPGAEETLTVTFDPNLHEEPKEKFQRTIFIPSNDPQTPEAEITVWVDILEGQ